MSAPQATSQPKKKSSFFTFGTFISLIFLIVIGFIIYVVYTIFTGPPAGHKCTPGILTWFGLFPECAAGLVCNPDGVCDGKLDPNDRCTKNDQCSTKDCAHDGDKNAPLICCPSGKSTYVAEGYYICDDVPLGGNCYSNGTSTPWCAGDLICVGYTSLTPGTCQPKRSQLPGTPCRKDDECTSGACWYWAQTDDTYRCCVNGVREYSGKCASWYCQNSTPKGQACIIDEQCVSGTCINKPDVCENGGICA